MPTSALLPECEGRCRHRPLRRNRTGGNEEGEEYGSKALGGGCDIGMLSQRGHPASADPADGRGAPADPGEYRTGGQM